MSRKSRSPGKNNVSPNPAGTKLLNGFFRAKFGLKPRVIHIDIDVETGRKSKYLEVLPWRNALV